MGFPPTRSIFDWLINVALCDSGDNLKTFLSVFFSKNLEYLPDFRFEMCITIVLDITSKNNAKVIMSHWCHFCHHFSEHFWNLLPDVSTNLKFFKVGTTLPIDLFVNLKTFIKLLKISISTKISKFRNGKNFCNLLDVQK